MPCCRIACYHGSCAAYCLPNLGTSAGKTTKTSIISACRIVAMPVASMLGTLLGWQVNRQSHQHTGHVSKPRGAAYACHSLMPSHAVVMKLESGIGHR